MIERLLVRVDQRGTIEIDESERPVRGVDTDMPQFEVAVLYAYFVQAGVEEDDLSPR